MASSPWLRFSRQAQGEELTPIVHENAAVVGDCLSGADGWCGGHLVGARWSGLIWAWPESSRRVDGRVGIELGDLEPLSTVALGQVMRAMRW